MIRALARKGGVIQINYHIGFLSQEFLDARRKIAAELRASDAAIEKKYGEDQGRIIRGEGKAAQALISSGKLPHVSWEKIIEHIDHVTKLVGPDHVGLGSDFDGAWMPDGMEDCSKLPRITEALLRKGYSEEDIRKILGGNLLRVMEEAERAAKDTPVEKK